MKGVKDSLPAEQLIEPCLNGRIDSHCNKLFHNKWIFSSVFFNIYVELPENIGSFECTKRGFILYFLLVLVAIE